jgi:hypothetical protein
MKPAWPKFSRPVYPKWIARPSAARAYAAVVGLMSSCDAFEKIAIQSIMSIAP